MLTEITLNGIFDVINTFARSINALRLNVPTLPSIKSSGFCTLKYNTKKHIASPKLSTRYLGLTHWIITDNIVTIAKNSILYNLYFSMILSNLLI